jgi:hypothetical protein
MAAVAVAGAASAQVTITGSIAAGMALKTHAPTSAGVATNSTGGFGMDGTSITFAASEDLGGGLSVSAKTSMDNVQYGSAVKGNNASLTIAGGFGSIAMAASKESGDGLSGNALGVRLDGAGFVASAGDSDSIKYTSPELIPGLKVAVLYGDTAVAGNEAATGLSGNVAAATYYLDYSSGPLTLGTNLTKYNKNTKGDLVNKTRLFGSYDLGVAKIGFGTQSGAVTNDSVQKSDRTVFGISMPMGAMTAGVGYGSIATTNSSGTKTTVSTTALNVNYAMSKRTSVVFDFSRTSGGVSTSSAWAEEGYNRVKVVHSF